jgi:hypothetical protein
MILPYAGKGSEIAIRASAGTGGDIHLHGSLWKSGTETKCWQSYGGKACG